MDLVPLAVVQAIHLAFSIFWFGTVLHSRLVVFPALRKLPPDYIDAVKRSSRDPRRTLLGAWGTVISGAARGAMSGGLDVSTAYGKTYLASLVIGTLMAVFLSGPWPRSGPFDRLYVAGFPVILVLMVAMRFGY